jgi:antitoxin component YwqK of YwqJK toxin-antitoxin module
MKRFLILLISTLTTVTAFGQQPEYTDSGFTNKAEAKNLTVNGLKEGKWVEYYGQYVLATVDSSKAITYNLSIYVDGNLNGIQREYWMDGVLHVETLYIDDTIEGIQKEYYYNGVVKYKSFYTKGIATKVMEYYYPGGELMNEQPYVNGKQNGIERQYYISGKLWGEIPYINDVPNGMAKSYYEDGKLKSKTMYSGNLNGVTTNYDENGNEIK